MFATSLYDLHLHDRGSVGFPAEIRPVEQDLLAVDKQNAEANLAVEAWKVLKAHWHVKGDLNSAGARQLTRSVFRQVLAICHSPQYEIDHKDSLAQDWAHIPIPKDKALLKTIAKMGDQVATLLNPLLDADRIIASLLGDKAPTLAVLQKRGGGPVRESELLVTFSYYGAAAGRWCGRPPVELEAQHRKWGDRTGDLLNREVYFANVPEKVWRYELGGYPVLKKWLGYRDEKRRAGQPLSLADTRHFRSMVQRIAALLILHEKLDMLYETATADCFSAEGLNLR